MAVDVTVMITIGETGTMDEMEVGEEGGGRDEEVIMEVGKTDRRTGTGIAMTGDRCLLDDTCGVDEVDRGVHREGPGMGMLYGGTSEPGALPVWTHVDPRHLRSQSP